MATTELAVVGAGPAGLAAAVIASELGLHVTLLDELPAPGGQYLAEVPGSRAHPPVARAERAGLDLLRRAGHAAIDWRCQTLVWRLDRDLTLDLYEAERWERLSAKAVILATGAREQVVPFPGWTLPGVMTAGAAQLLAKRHGLVPGRRVLLAGSGPLLLPVAVRLAELGAEVVAIVEATRLPSWLRYGPAVWGNWDRIAEARHYLGKLARARIPYRTGRAVTAALGSTRLEAVEVSRLDGQGRAVPGSAETVAVDALCIGFGLLPNTELAQLAGARPGFDPVGGGWVPAVDDSMQCEIAGVFVAGEAAGIVGAAAAMLEGRMAALGAAHLLGAVSIEQVWRAQGLAAQRRRRARNFGAMINTLFAPPSGLYDTIPDATVVCRCEEVTAGEVRAAIAAGAITLDALKTRTRVGQGPCQGRTCGPILARLIASQTGRPVDASGLFGVRPPIKPVPLAALAGGPLP